MAKFRVTNLLETDSKKGIWASLDNLDENKFWGNTRIYWHIPPGTIVEHWENDACQFVVRSIPPKERALRAQCTRRHQKGFTSLGGGGRAQARISYQEFVNAVVLPQAGVGEIITSDRNYPPESEWGYLLEDADYFCSFCGWIPERYRATCKVGDHDPRQRDEEILEARNKNYNVPLNLK